MIYIVYPYDSTTKFLLEIPNILQQKHGNVFTVINIEASDSSYAKGLELISKIPDDSLVLFMGHGQSDFLYGADSHEFEKKKFIGKSEIKIFSNKFLFSLSCILSSIANLIGGFFTVFASHC